MVTAPVDVPVLMLVALLDEALRLTVPPRIEVVPVTVTVPLIPIVSSESPTVRVSASALEPIVMVSQLAELQMLTLVAVELPMARAPAAATSTDGVRTLVSA
jgi:hypothetical protein